ncbi:MAG: T9SS type A sorting domain-containing protein [Bacteroidales bacterium]|nr:T9SS type A sorting domain-containing protein [Bacteroidales bacterium]MCF8332921.1 T9SS type A sorting domain-containing protein [Bacteroidales bacterium]
MERTTTMKKLKRIFLNARNAFSVILITLIFLAGCYEFTHVGQPEEAHNNSYFDVDLVAHEDDGDNDWTTEGLQDIGLFGAMIPEGWTVEDSIYFQIVSTDTTLNNDGYLVHDEEHSQMLEDSIGSNEGYYWWGASTTEEVDMSYFDSLYFSPRIVTDEQVGTFYLRYAIGDPDYWDRYPADDVTDPQEIQIIDASGIASYKRNAFKVYPNPTSGEFVVNAVDKQYEQVNLEVYSLSGKMVKKVHNVDSESSISLSGLNKGVYILKIYNEKEIVGSERIILK